ncbi:MAG: DHHW family protein [Bacillota bacterium]
MKNKAIAIGFSALLLLTMLFHIVLPDLALSIAERRTLAVMPQLVKNGRMNEDFFEDFERYALDQFPLRDTLRGVKAFVQLYILRQTDNNGLYFMGDSVVKIDGPLDEKSVAKFADKINALYEEHLAGMRVFLAVIPDKNAYAGDIVGAPGLSYEAMLESLLPKLNDKIAPIDLYDALTLEDYYKTDPHWRQERLQKVIDRLKESMGFSADIDLDAFDAVPFAPFYGAYYGQAALPMPPETLFYLTDENTASATVENVQDKSSETVYDPGKLGKLDSYEVFLSGATPFQVITNPQSQTERDLILFRDSFGSSLAPLLLKQYRRITLVDLRYMSSALLEDRIEFKDQDVLFLYSSLVVNQSDMLR